MNKTLLKKIKPITAYNPPFSFKIIYNNQTKESLEMLIGGIKIEHLHEYVSEHEHELLAAGYTRGKAYAIDDANIIRTHGVVKEV